MKKKYKQLLTYIKVEYISLYSLSSFHLLVHNVCVCVGCSDQELL